MSTGEAIESFTVSRNIKLMFPGFCGVGIVESGVL